MREMKDSGVEWIGKIPKDWEITKNKYIFEIRSGDAINKAYLIENGSYPVYGGGECIGFCNSYNVKEEKNKKFLLIGRVGARCGCITTINGACWATDNALIASSKILNKYYMHALVAANLNQLSDSNAQPLITATKILNLKMPNPSNDEKEKISMYLDKKCSEIDALATDIQKEITTLEQYKRSVITEAVTKGLDKDAEMKDSGVEWIGKIPKDWQICRLKYVLKEHLKYGATETGIDYDEALPRYIRITDITSNGKLRETGKLSLTEMKAKDFILKDKTILFARSGATVGKAFFYKKEYGRAAFAGYLISAVINEKILLPEWVYYYVNTFSYWEWINSVFSQSTIQNIGADKYSQMLIPICPEIDKQRQIILFLKAKCTEIDQMISDKQKQLSLLDSHKKSLIYEYVTGKKEVPPA